MKAKLTPSIAVTLTIAVLLTLVGILRTFAQQSPNSLTGNWAVKIPIGDGTFRTTYLNLIQDGPKITGSIRVTQFYYVISESTAAADSFVLTGSMPDGKNVRTVR